MLTFHVHLTSLSLDRQPTRPQGDFQRGMAGRHGNTTQSRAHQPSAACDRGTCGGARLWARLWATETVEAYSSIQSLHRSWDLRVDMAPPDHLSAASPCHRPSRAPFHCPAVTRPGSTIVPQPWHCIRTSCRVLPLRLKISGPIVVTEPLHGPAGSKTVSQARLSWPPSQDTEKAGFF